MMAYWGLSWSLLGALLALNGRPTLQPRSPDHGTSQPAPLAHSPPNKMAPSPPVTTPERTGARLSLHGSRLFLFGGVEGKGRPSASMFFMDLRAAAQWRELQQKGDVPTAKDSHNGSLAVWGEQVWLLSSAENDPELRRFEPISGSWTLADQQGCLPDRRLLSAMPLKGFEGMLAYGPYLLAFGIEQSDENQTPGSSGAAGAGLRPKALMLHAYDPISSTW
jgi:hypothetical protein